MMSRFVVFCLLVTTVVLSGCGGAERPAGMPALVPCTVIVTEGGTPLHSTFVSLYKEDGSSPQWGIGGVADEAGKATLATHGQFLGAPKGTYKVILTRRLQEGAPPMPKPTASDAEFLAHNQACEKLPPAKETIPDAYLKPETTPLTITVGSAKEITVEVKK